MEHGFVMSNVGELYRIVPVIDGQMTIKVPDEEKFRDILFSLGYCGIESDTQLLDYAGQETDVIFFSGWVEMSLQNAINSKKMPAMPFRKDILMRALLKDYPEAIKLLVAFGSLPE